MQQVDATGIGFGDCLAKHCCKKFTFTDVTLKTTIRYYVSMQHVVICELGSEITDVTLKKGLAVSKDTTHKLLAQAPNAPPLSQLVHVCVCVGGGALPLTRHGVKLYQN